MDHKPDTFSLWLGSNLDVSIRGQPFCDDVLFDFKLLAFQSKKC